MKTNTKRLFLLLTAMALTLCVFFLPGKAQAAEENGLIFEEDWMTDGYILTGTAETISGQVVIPATYEGKPVVAIGERAFESRHITSVVIPDTVEEIREKAFVCCYELTSITLPDSLTYLGVGAFYECTALTSLALPGGFTKLEEDTFRGCTGLQSVALPEGVECIGAWSFYNCISLVSVTFPDSLTTIENSAFTGCDSLKEVFIPKTLTTIGDHAFLYCDGLEGIWVDPEHPKYCSDEKGVLYNKTKTAIRQVPGGISGHYTIPDTVKHISDQTFHECRKLTSVIISEGVESISDAAFASCSSLTSITIPVSVTYIGMEVFHNDPELKDIYYGGTREQWEALGCQDFTVLPTIHYQHIHTYTPANVVEPTCTTDGYAEYVCVHGDSYRQVLPATGHTLVEDPGEAATCTKPGYKPGSKCTVCDYRQQEEIAPAGHDFRDGVCTICGAPERATGDLDDIEGVSVEDVITLVLSISMPDIFALPEGVSADFTGDGQVTIEDAIKLLLHISMPDIFPL